MAPLIGISSWRQEVSEEGNPVAMDSAVAHVTYLKAVAKAGGIPVVLPQLDTSEIDALLDELPAVVLVGGPDVEPSLYGAARDERTITGSRDRDEFDVALARACVERDHPMLAICRGIQVLNVALGGSLVQHLDEHMDRARYNETVHKVEVVPSSRLASIVGTESLAVNSLHHQAIDRIGDRLDVVGRADDGTVEAIEPAGTRHVLGVQWHPELLRHRDDHLALFRDLVALAGSSR